MRMLALFALTALVLAACSRTAPPQGRWEGTFDSGDTAIVARAEIEPDGQVRVSAPDLTGVAAEDRSSLHQRLDLELADGWSDVAPRPFDFDGKVFRKVGGIAPQMIWDKDNKSMTLVVYLGTRPALNIPLRRVNEFSDDPWPSK